MFSGDGVGLVMIEALICDMDNWVGLVDVGNVVSKERQTVERFLHAQIPRNYMDRARNKVDLTKSRMSNL